MSSDRFRSKILSLPCGRDVKDTFFSFSVNCFSEVFFFSVPFRGQKTSVPNLHCQHRHLSYFVKLAVILLTTPRPSKLFFVFGLFFRSRPQPLSKERTHLSPPARTVKGFCRKTPTISQLVPLPTQPSIEQRLTFSPKIAFRTFSSVRAAECDHFFACWSGGNGTWPIRVR